MYRRTADPSPGHRATVRLARRFEQHTRDYAVVTDPGHDYGVLHYYIARETEARQLADHGFATLDTFDANGSALTAHVDDRTSPSLLYVARRV